MTAAEQRDRPGCRGTSSAERTPCPRRVVELGDGRSEHQDDRQQDADDGGAETREPPRSTPSAAPTRPWTRSSPSAASRRGRSPVPGPLPVPATVGRSRAAATARGRQSRPHGSIDLREQRPGQDDARDRRSDRGPKSRVRPRSAPRASIATSGPGCGGTRPCRTDRPASAGMPTRMIGMSECAGRPASRPGRAGRRRPRRTAACRGSPRSPAIAHGSRAGRTRPTIVSTILSAPPESASSLPTIAPSAISRPTAADGRAEPDGEAVDVSARRDPADDARARPSPASAPGTGAPSAR